MMKIILVHNPRSGSALSLRELKKQFKQANIEITATFAVQDNLADVLKPYINQKDIVVAAYGGDGTLSSVASILAGTDTVFAPLAGGTLNHFTKDLGVPQDLAEAIAMMKRAKPQKVDIAQVNGRLFLNNSSLGLYPSTLQMRDEAERKSTNKWVAAIIASFKAFVRYRSYTVTIDNDTFKTPFVFVGNNDYKLEKRLIGARTRLDQGKLSVYSVAAVSRWSLFRAFMRALSGSVKSVDEIKIWKAKRVVIKTKARRLRISRDGEHERVRTPLEYEILPHALIVLGSAGPVTTE